MKRFSRLIVIIVMSVVLCGCSFTAGENKAFSGGGQEGSKEDSNDKKKTEKNDSEGNNADSNKLEGKTDSSVEIKIVEYDIFVDGTSIEYSKEDRKESLITYFSEFFNGKVTSDFIVDIDFEYGDYELGKEVKSILDMLKIPMQEKNEVTYYE